jgi:formate/nitrite transporter FocA (FNT family)
MILSILAGLMIAVGGVINLSVGGALGAFMFSLGLLTVLIFKLELFTGKAGLLATNEMKIGKLSEIWVGNFIGTAIVAILLTLTPKGVDLFEKATQIVAIRNANDFYTNFVYGGFCGLMMYLAVSSYALGGLNPVYAILPVAAFILCGFNHCVADMFYLNIGSTALGDYFSLIPTTLGNIYGCCLIPWTLRMKRS